MPFPNKPIPLLVPLTGFAPGTIQGPPPTSWLAERSLANVLNWTALLSVLFLLWAWRRASPVAVLDRRRSRTVFFSLGLCGLGYFLDTISNALSTPAWASHALLVAGVLAWWNVSTFFQSEAGARDPKSSAEWKRLVFSKNEELAETSERLLGVVAERNYLATLVESSDDAIIGKDLQGIITFWNVGAEKLFGYHSDEILGKPGSILIPQTHLHEEGDVLTKLRLGKPVDPFESIRLHKDGRTIEVSLAISRILNQAGEVVGLSKIARDITARKKVEADLKSSEQRFLRFMDNFPGFAWIKDEEGRHVFVNESMRKLIGKPLEEILDQTTDALFPPELAELYQESDRRVFETGEAIEIVERAQFEDGSHGHGMIHKFLIPAASGGGRMIGGMAFDITRRVNAEREVQESEKRFRELADAMPQIVWTADAQGNFLFLNERWFDYTGLSRAKADLSRLSGVVHPDDLDRLLSHWKASLHSGKPLESEFRLKNHKTGEYRWQLGRANPAKDDKGAIVCWYGTGTDIEDQKRAQESLRTNDRILRAIGNSIDFGIWTCDAQGQMTYVSESFLKLVGLTQKECHEYGWAKPLHPDEREQAVEAWKQCVRDERNWDIELNYLGVDGLYHPTLSRGVPVRDENGKLGSWAGITLDIGRLRHAESALRESEDRQRRALETAKLGHWEWNPVTVKFTYQDSLSVLYGRADDNPFLSFDDFLGVVHPDDQIHVRHASRKGMIPNNSYSIEYRVVWPDGSIHWLASRGQAYFDSNGKPLRLVGVSLDITDRKVAEAKIQLLNEELEQRVKERTAELDKTVEALRESERMFRAIFDSTFQLMGLMTPEGRLLEANRTALNFAGVKREDVIGKFLYDGPWWAHSQEARERLKNAIAQAAEGHFVRYEEEHPSLEGILVPVDFSINPVTDDSGAVTLLIPEGREITEKRKAMEALAQSEARFRGAFDASAIGIALVAPDGRFLQVNQALLDMLGYSEAELLGMTIQGITHPDDVEKSIEHVQNLHSGKIHCYQLEKRYIHKSQRIVWVVITVSLVRDGSGKPLHFVGQVDDVTDRKQVAEDLRRARDEAMEATRAKGNFLANMSHEIRTPMNGVIGMTELLLDTNLNNLQRSYAETIRGSGEALLTVINDILDFSKIEAGKLTLESSPISLECLIEQVADLLAPRAHQKGLEINTRIDPNLPAKLKGDPIRIRQILTNLVGNAVKFTDRGEINLEASLVKASEFEASFRISVRDTGIGIPKGRQSEVFNSFTQIEDGNSRRHGGTGLGLAICRDLIKLIGGNLGLESAPGQGSLFWFEMSLPIDRAVEEKSEAAGLITNLDFIKGLRVLVVDDQRTSRDIITEILIDRHCRAQSAPSGPLALEILEQCPHDDPVRVVLLDHQMPSMDGLETAQRIRADPRYQNPSIILLTSLGSAVERTEGVECLYDAQLVKPIRRSQLLETLSNLVSPSMPCNQIKPKLDVAGDRPEKLDLKILLAEDNEVNRRVAIGLTRRLGGEIVAAENGRKALEALANDSFDLILMDVQMPEMDGYAATQAIRELEQGTGRHIPIIAMTAHAMQGDREKCLNAGMDDYLTKPLRISSLRDMLFHWKSEIRKYSSLPAADSAERILLSNTLREICGDDHKFAREVVRLMLKETPNRVERLRVALLEKHADHVAWEAHALKGVFLTMGAADLAAIHQEIIVCAKLGNLTKVESLHQCAAEQWKRLEAEAIRYLDTPQT